MSFDYVERQIKSRIKNVERLLTFDTTMLEKVMNMEKKFREALLKVLQDGTFKNVRALALAAEVDQGGLSRFLATMGYGGKGEVPKLAKGNLNLQTVSKLVDSMGGVLIFPWELQGNSSKSELIEAQRIIDEQKEEIKKIQTERDAFENILLKRISSPVEYRENKSSAS